MGSKLFVILIIVAAVLFGIHEQLPQKAWQWFSHTQLAAKVNGISGAEQSLPAPLRGLIDPSINSHLTASGVVEETNKQRDENGGLAPLHVNAKLQAAAQHKVDDMFAQQYFEHESPDGKSPADIIRAQGYEYIVVGENLALGNFIDDEALVTAWMNSPGHRANILNSKYQEIGVAVKKGTYEGKEVWLAVQEFGAPLSTCPSPSQNLKGQIDANRTSIANMQSSLQQQKADIDANRYQSREEYNQAVAKYNAEAAQLNQLSEETKKLVEQYNAEVNSFNSCLESNS